MNKLYPHTFKCTCGKTIQVELSCLGCYNSGEAMTKTGWEYGVCAYTEHVVWLCTECAARAKMLAQQLFDLTGTPYYYWTGLIDKEIKDKWCEDVDNAKRNPK